MTAIPVDEFLTETGQTYRDGEMSARERSLARMVADPPTKGSAPAPPISGVFVCPDCGRRAGSGPGLASHRRSAHGESAPRKGKAVPAPKAPREPVGPVARQQPPAAPRRSLIEDALCDSAEALLLIVEQAAVGGVAPDTSAVNAARWRLGAAIADYRERA